MKQFFQDDKGQLSSMRLYCFIALIEAVYLSASCEGVEMVSLWLVAAFAPKVVQKFAERK